MDIVEFVKSEFGVELYDWQEKHIRNLYELSRDSPIRIVMPRYAGRNDVYIYMSHLKELIPSGKTNDCE